MKAKILDGKKLAEKILINLKKKIKEKKLKLTLAVVLVGENRVSEIFINQKRIACENVGVNFKLFKFPAKIKGQKPAPYRTGGSGAGLKKEIEKIVKNPNISGVIIQLPLLKKFMLARQNFAKQKLGGPEEFLNLIPEEKDIDVLSEKSLGKFYQGILLILPPTVSGILNLLKNYQIKVKGKNIVIVGAGRLVGFPLALQLLREKATVSVLNEFTKDTPSFTKKADILISAVGKPNLIKSEMIKKGAIVIDAGTSFKKGKLVGDIDFKSVSKKASYITPVPGGIGPMTVACLIENLIKINE